jgi:flavodoxin/ferredoxin
MKKVIIIYSSQNGSTYKIADRIKTTFLNTGNKVDLINTRQSQKLNLGDYDLIGIGCPVYMFRPSYEIIDFIDSIKDLKGKKIFTFVTYGSEIGDGANILRKRINKLGAIDAGHFSCAGKHLFPGYTNRGYLFSPESPTNNDLISADIFVKNILLNNNTVDFKKNKYDKSAHIISRFERFVTNRFLIKNLYSYFFHIDRNLCCSCSTCIKNCPTKNIQKNDNNQIIWSRNCILCTKCVISCPQKAISSPISWFIFSPFLAYNIYRTLKNKILFYKIKKT